MCNYKNVILLGFRATGKSTLGKLLAKRLGWELAEMDEMIVERTGKSINELTEGGTKWNEFRKIEHEILEELLSKPNVVISAGGGVGVNNIIHEDSGQTFGELNKNLLDEAQDLFRILLTCEEALIAERIRQAEIGRTEAQRPVFTNDKLQSPNYKNDTQRIDAIVDDSIQMYQTRKPLYSELTKYSFDSTDLEPLEILDRVMFDLHINKNENFS